MDRLSGKGETLVVTPILSQHQVGASSVDVRLGNQFIVFRMQRFGDYSPYHQPKQKLRQLQERQVVRYGQHFVLHPGVLVLGCTFEYMSMPCDLEGQIEGRSSWARLGLQIATASPVEPEFKGVLTLELSNVGTIPLKLYPGVRIAQLVVRSAEPGLTERSKRGRKYRCPVGPEFSRAHEDADGDLFARRWRPE